MTRTQYAILASALPRMSDEDLQLLLGQMETVEVQRHTLVGVVSSILPRLSSEDMIRLRDLIVIVTAARQDREKGGLHAFSVEAS